MKSPVVRGWEKGNRVRIFATPGLGAPPAQGARGIVVETLEDGTVLVEFGDGKLGLFAPWELKSDA